MITNPFSRKPKTPVDQALEAFDSVRSEAADYAETIRDAAADIADTLTEIGPPAPKRKLPLIAMGAAAALGIAYVVRSRLGGGSSVDQQFPPPAAKPAVDVAARTTAAAEDDGGEPAPATATEAPKEPAVTVTDTAAEEPIAPTATEEPKEEKAKTAESAAQDAGDGDPGTEGAEKG